MCVMSSQLIGAARAACALVGWPGSLKEIKVLSLSSICIQLRYGGRRNIFGSME